MENLIEDDTLEKGEVIHQNASHDHMGKAGTTVNRP